VAPIRTLLLDNHDSFTFNLFQFLAEVNGCDPVVVRNDAATWEELAEESYDNIVVSPGPGRPQHPRDLGVCADAIRHARVPLLGVCLGHQGIGHVCGGDVGPAPEVMHGRLSAVYHDETELFAGIPQGFAAVRYHSLCVAPDLPPALEAIAWTQDGVLMGVRHRTRPQWGVQFHPESICTEHGHRLLANFRDLTPRRLHALRNGRPRSMPLPPTPSSPGATPLAVQVRTLDALPDPERAFVALYGDASDAFWLDSARAGDERSRFSFMGAPGGPLASLVTYDAEARRLTIDRAGATEIRHGTSIFEHLRAESARLVAPPNELPFDFDGGFVGWFGYELKSDCDGDAAHASSLPDAALLFADRLIAFDHLEHRTYAVAVCAEEDAVAAAGWAERTIERLMHLPELPPLALPAAGPEVEFTLSRSRAGYLADIRRCQEYLAAGESYEICLTNRLSTPAAPDPLLLYRALRHINPAPFSAFLRLGGAAVVSSSPERFLQVARDGRVEAKPIKGTCRRGRTPEEDRALAEALRTSEKDRAENLMITDLLRNDIGIVSEIGSVAVPHLMALETFETVHQLVSTITGRLRPGFGAADCIQACFPGGSMTGAPKKRTMEIIDELETEARGVYSGAIGYVGLSGGSDLNIVIRTIVMDGERTTIGAGGAIVMQSDPEGELEELLLKAEAPMRAVALASAGRPAWRVLDPQPQPRPTPDPALMEAS
jgi:para-aminobenzoate synthetase